MTNIEDAWFFLRLAYTYKLNYVDEPLAKYTTFGIGGPASCIVYPNNSNELSQLLKYSNKQNIPVIFIGSGSNLLIWDKGFNGIVSSHQGAGRVIQNGIAI